MEHSSVIPTFTIMETLFCPRINGALAVKTGSSAALTKNSQKQSGCVSELTELRRQFALDVNGNPDKAGLRVDKRRRDSSGCHE